MSRTEELLKTRFKPIPEPDPGELEKLKRKIKLLERKLGLKEDVLVKKAVLKKKMQETVASTRVQDKCIWCQKMVKRGTLTHINGIGDFCPECIEKRNRDINER